MKGFNSDAHRRGVDENGPARLAASHRRRSHASAIPAGVWQSAPLKQQPRQRDRRWTWFKYFTETLPLCEGYL